MQTLLSWLLPAPLYVWLFPASSRRASGEDETARALRDIERQGAHLASLAHICAGALIFLFSMGSLISLSAHAFNAVLASWNNGAVDVPNAISVAVSTLLVLAMDTAMLYAASVLRLLAVRGASGREAWIHRAVLISAALLEAATYTYMSWLYDRPETWALWALTIARALAAPLYAVYLSMASPLPIGPRDIFARAELASGRGVLRDVTALANDPKAPLDKKMRMFGAASTMADRERERLGRLISAVSDDTPDTPAMLPAPHLQVASLAGGIFTPSPTGGPSGGDDTPDGGPSGGDDTPDGGPGGAPRKGGARRSASASPTLRLVSDTPATPRNGSGMTRAQQEALLERDMKLARMLLTHEPDISTRELARRLSAGRVYPCHPQRAGTIRLRVAGEDGASSTHASASQGARARA